MISAPSLQHIPFIDRIDESVKLFFDEYKNKDVVNPYKSYRRYCRKKKLKMISESTFDIQFQDILAREGMVQFADNIKPHVRSVPKKKKDLPQINPNTNVFEPCTIGIEKKEHEKILEAFYAGMSYKEISEFLDGTSDPIQVSKYLKSKFRGDSLEAEKLFIKTVKDAGTFKPSQTGRKKIKEDSQYLYNHIERLSLNQIRLDLKYDSIEIMLHRVFHWGSHQVVPAIKNHPVIRLALWYPLYELFEKYKGLSNYEDALEIAEVYLKNPVDPFHAINDYLNTKNNRIIRNRQELVLTLILTQFVPWEKMMKDEEEHSARMQFRKEENVKISELSSENSISKLDVMMDFRNGHMTIEELSANYHCTYNEIEKMLLEKMSMEDIVNQTLLNSWYRLPNYHTKRKNGIMADIFRKKSADNDETRLSNIADIINILYTIRLESEHDIANALHIPESYIDIYLNEKFHDDITRRYLTVRKSFFTIIKTSTKDNRKGMQKLKYNRFAMGITRLVKTEKYSVAAISKRYEIGLSYIKMAIQRVEPGVMAIYNNQTYEPVSDEDVKAVPFFGDLLDWKFDHFDFTTVEKPKEDDIEVIEEGTSKSHNLTIAYGGKTHPIVSKEIHVTENGSEKVQKISDMVERSEPKSTELSVEVVSSRHIPLIDDAKYYSISEYYKVGLVYGRHDMPVDEFIFNTAIPDDKFADFDWFYKRIEQWWVMAGKPSGIRLYTTGIAQAITTMVVFCHDHKISLLHMYHNNPKEKTEHVSEWIQHTVWNFSNSKPVNFEPAFTEYLEKNFTDYYFYKCSTEDVRDNRTLHACVISEYDETDIAKPVLENPMKKTVFIYDDPSIKFELQMRIGQKICEFNNNHIYELADKDLILNNNMVNENTNLLNRLSSKAI